jgi:site-specific DNA-methyltransferase (adenine-specific)
MIKEKSIDMVLCDLPYETTNQPWDKMIPFEPLWNEYTRIIKDNGAIVLTCVEPFRSKLIMSNLKMFRYDLIWEKNKSTGFLNAKKQPLRKHESIAVFYKKQPVFNPQKTTGHKPVNSYTKHTSDGNNYGKTKKGISGGGQTDRYPTSILKFNVVNNDNPDKIHSAQKPIELLEYLIRTYTNEGDLILDNAMGSGNTCIAARNLKRDYIGIEKYQDFFLDAQEKIEIVNYI